MYVYILCMFSSVPCVLGALIGDNAMMMAPVEKTAMAVSSDAELRQESPPCNMIIPLFNEYSAVIYSII